MGICSNDVVFSVSGYCNICDESYDDGDDPQDALDWAAYHECEKEEA